MDIPYLAIRKFVRSIFTDMEDGKRKLESNMI